MLEDVPGSQGHAYGARYPERWVWARCSSFEDEDAVLEAFTGQVRRGPYLTPFITTIGLRRRRTLDAVHAGCAAAATFRWATGASTSPTGGSD